MADAVIVPTSGFSVPPVPNAPAAPAPAPQGFHIPPLPSSATETFTQAQVQEQIAAALKAATPAPAPAAPAPTAAPARVDLTVDSGTDPVLSSLTSIFAALGDGLDIQRALGNALSRGDASLIDTAYIAEKGGAQASHAATLAKAIVERVTSQSAAATSAVYETAGGQPQWDAAASVFDKNAPAHLKVVIAGLLESGNRDSIKAGAQTVLDFVRQNGLVMTPANLVQAGAGVGAAQALSKEEFQTELFKLDKNSRTFESDRATLFARRAVGKQLSK